MGRLPQFIRGLSFGNSSFVLRHLTTTMFWAIYGAVFFAALAMMVREGLWSNAITLINVIVSGLLAFGFYSPLAIMLDEQLNGQFTYILDCVCLLAIFIVSMF